MMVGYKRTQSTLTISKCALVAEHAAIITFEIEKYIYINLESQHYDYFGLL